MKSASNMTTTWTQSSAAPLQLDHARMSRAAGDLLQILGSYLPEGFDVWTAEYRPDVARYLAEAETALQDAISAGDKQQFAQAVGHCSAMYLKGVAIFEKDGKRVRRMTYSGILRVCAGVGIN